MLPLYEAKMFHQFDHRWATYDGLEVRDSTLLEKESVRSTALPRYWVAETQTAARLSGNWNKSWLLAFRDIARSTDERTMISTALPRVAVGHTAPIVDADCPLVLSAVWSSLAFDYVARQKVGGTHMTYSYLKQLPMFDRETLEAPTHWDSTQPLRKWIEERVLRLIDTSGDIAAALGTKATGWHESERLVIRAELDAAFLVLFGATRTDAEHILDSFSIVRRKEWIQHGRFLTKERVLESFEQLNDAIEAGLPQISTLNTSQGATA